MKINLIPPELLPKKASRIPYLIVAGVYILALIFFVTQYQNTRKLGADIRDKQILLTMLRGNLDILAGAPEELEAIINEGMELVITGETLRYISQSNLSWVRVLHEIDRAASAGLGFEELNFDSSAPEIHLIGFYVGELPETSILKFVTNLQTSPFLEETFNEIKLASSVSIEGRENARNFEIIMSFNSN